MMCIKEIAGNQPARSAPGITEVGVASGVTRGERSNYFGVMCEEGILWTDTRNGRQWVERYDDAPNGCIDG